MMTPHAGPLLDQLRASRSNRSGPRRPPNDSTGTEAGTEAGTGAGPAASSFDFSTLPAFDQLRLQRSAADMLGITQPYYRTGAAVSGARVTIDGQERIQFASYDYLGLNKDPRIAQAMADAATEFGISATASRLAGGQRPPHRALERQLAGLYGAEDAITLVSGHATNIATIAALTGPRDLLLIDTLCHNSIYEGARMSGATRMTFPHNDWDWVEATLAQIRNQYENVLIAVEGLYSMDGDLPDLARLVGIKSRHKAWLMVDDAHGLGVAGETGRGAFEACGIDPATVEIWMGTLSKTLCACGGYIAGSRALCDFLRYKAGGLVYSVGLPPPIAAAAGKALDLMLAEPHRVARLHENGGAFLAAARAAGLDCGASAGLAVIPVIIGDSIRCVLAADRLGARGIHVMPVIPPGVPEKLARLRFFVTASHGAEDIETAVRETAAVLAELQDLDPMSLLAR